MSSSSSSVRNYAVIETIADDRVHVTLVYQLQQFSRNWVDQPGNWPQTVIWFNDTEGDLECRILKIDSKEECDKYAILYEQTQLARLNHMQQYLTDSVDPTILIGEFNSLKDEVFLLRKMVNQQQNQIYQIRSGCIVQSKVYTVGSHRMEVSVRSVSDAMVVGLTASGFMNLASSYFPEGTFENKCWKELDKETQEQIHELLSFFVLHGLTPENETPPKPSELTAKYKAIYVSFTTMLNNRKYNKKDKRNNATIEHSDNSNSSSQQPSTSKKKRKGKQTTQTESTADEDEVPDAIHHLEAITNAPATSVEHSSDEPQISTIKFDDYDSFY